MPTDRFAASEAEDLAREDCHIVLPVVGARECCDSGYLNDFVPLLADWDWSSDHY